MKPIYGSVMVVGDVMLDSYITGNAVRLSPEAPVPVVTVTDRFDMLGGAGNVALNLSGLACGVILVGVVGDDLAGRSVKHVLDNDGIIHNLFTSGACPTTVKTRVMAHQHQLVRFDDERCDVGDDGRVEFIIDAVHRNISKVGAIILSDYSKGVLSLKVTEDIIGFGKQLGVPVLVDPKRGDWKRYQGADIITPNTSELEESANVKIGDVTTRALSCAKDALLDYGFKAIVVTRGAEGVLLVTPTEYSVIPAQARSVFDVSGAGDTVIATLAACMCSGHTLQEAVRVANCAAGVVVEKPRTYPIKIEDLVDAEANCG